MTTQPGRLDLKIYKGAALDEVFFVEDEDENGITTITDLTGYTARAQARIDYTSATPFMNLTTENGGITITGIEGKIRLFMAATATDDITSTEGVWDLELIPAAGESNVIRLLQGSVCVSDEVTRP